MTIQQHLARGDTPYLKPRQEAGMSEVLWHNSLDSCNIVIISSYDSKGGKPFKAQSANARYIVTASTWPELLWKSYQTYTGICQKHKETAALVSAIEILLALDAAGRLGWREKEKGK